MTDKFEIGSRRAWAGVFIAALAAGSLSSRAVPVDEPATDQVEETRAALEKWVETRRIISRERQEWALGHEVLQDRIDLVQREIDALRKRMAEAESSIAEADEKRGELMGTNAALKRTTASLEETVKRTEARTGDLLKRLPDPIAERVRPLSQQFPAPDAETKLTLSQRYQNSIGVLNAINKFNREISVTSEVRTLGDGTTAEVTALYVGIGQGYYVNQPGDAAGIGSGAGEAWAWTSNSTAAVDIATAIAIYKNEQAAEFVRLPLRIE